MWTEVTVRLGDTLLDVKTLGPADSFRIGTAPGVDLPTPLATDFPLVAPGGVVNLLPGMRDGADIALGLVRVSIVSFAGERPRADLGRPAFGDGRMGGYLGASAVVQVGIAVAVLAVVMPAPAIVLPAPRVVATTHAAWKTRVVAHGEVEPVPPPRRPRPAPVVAAIARVLGVAPGPTKLTGAAARAYEQSSGQIVAEGFAGLVAGVMGHADLAKAMAEQDPLWTPEASDDGSGFGGAARKFDPKLALDPTGRYATVAHGHAAGDDYDLPTGAPALPAVELCGSRACVVDGATGKDAIAAALGVRTASLGACFKYHARAQAPATTTVSFVIATDGSVSHARGTDALGECVAAVVAETTFPAADVATHVRYPVTFRPHSG